MDDFFELKGKMMNILKKQDGIPQEVIDTIKKTFYKLGDLYSEMRCNNSSIESYIEGNLRESIAVIQGEMGEQIKTEQYEEFNYILGQVQKNIEQELDDDEKQKQDKRIEQNIQYFGESNNKHGKAERIVDQIYIALKDIQSRQNNILQARGYSDRQIEDINDEAMSFIRHSSNKNEEEIYLSLRENDKTIKNQMIELYEEYIHQRDEKDPSEKSERDNFKEGLKEGAPTLEEQYEDVKEFMEKEPEYKKEDRDLSSLFK